MPNGDDRYRPPPPPLWEQVNSLMAEKKALEQQVRNLEAERTVLQQRVKKLRGMVADQAEDDR